MANGSYFGFDDDNTMKYTFSQLSQIITWKLGKLKPHSPIYSIKDN